MWRLLAILPTLALAVAPTFPMTVDNAEHLGGVPASVYALSSGAIANADALGGLNATEYLRVADAAADSHRLGGRVATDYLLADATAADSARLGGRVAAGYLPVEGIAADSARLGGLLPSDYLLVEGVAADAAKLGGLPAQDYLLRAEPAVNALQLDGREPNTFVSAMPHDSGAGMRNIAGSVDYGGAATNGQGFTVARVGGGYQLTWSQAFAAPPSVVVTPTNVVWSIASAPDGSTATVACVAPVSLAITSCGFSFIAVGPTS